MVEDQERKKVAKRISRMDLEVVVTPSVLVKKKGYFFIKVLLRLLEFRVSPIHGIPGAEQSPVWRHLVPDNVSWSKEVIDFIQKQYDRNLTQKLKDKIRHESRNKI